MSDYSDAEAPLLHQGSGRRGHRYPAPAGSHSNTHDHSSHPSTTENAKAWVAQHSANHESAIHSQRIRTLEIQHWVNVKYIPFFAYQRYFEPDYSQLKQVLTSARSSCEQHLGNIATFKENNFSSRSDKKDAYKALKSEASDIERLWNDVKVALNNCHTIQKRLLSGMEWVDKYPLPKLAFKEFEPYSVDENLSISWLNDVKSCERRFDGLEGKGEDTTKVVTEFQEILERAYAEDYAKEIAYQAQSQELQPPEEVEREYRHREHVQQVMDRTHFFSDE